MKKHILSFAVASLLALATTSPIQAQDFAFNRVSLKQTAFYSLASFIDTTISKEMVTDNLIRSSSGSTKEVNLAAKEYKAFNRLTKHFEKEFKGATDARWSKANTGFNGSFRRDGLLHHVYYNKGGYLNYLMISYMEEKLPADVKKAITEAYEDYRIMGVNEIHDGNIVVYVATLESLNKIKQVVVCNGEVNLYKEFKKSL